jgi:DNA polymerase III delta prime subunit
MSTTVAPEQQVMEQAGMAESGAVPYANGMELLQHLCHLLDERLAEFVEEMPETRQRVDFNLSGMVVSDNEAKRLLGRPAVTAQRFRSGSLWQATAARRGSHVPSGSLPLQVVQERFGLNPFEVECMLVCLAPELEARYQKLFGYVNDDVTQKYPSVDLLLRLLSMPDESATCRSLLTPASPLLRDGLLVWVDDQASGSPLSRCLKVDSAVVQFLFQDYKLDAELESVWLERDYPPEANSLWATNTDAAHSINSYIARYRQQDAIKRDRLVISVIGRSGSGRRHAVESACWQAGLGVIALDCARVIRHPRLEQMIRRAFRDSLLHASPLILGNFEAALQNLERGPEFRTTLERQVEEHGWIVFVLREERESGGAWFPRHRHVAIDIPELSNEARKNHWVALLAESSPLSAAEADEIAEALAVKFRLPPGQIAIAFRRCAHVLGGKDADTAAWRAQLHIEAAQISAPRLGALAKKIKPLYQWPQLVLPEKKKELVRDVVRHVRQRRRVMEEWNFNSLMSRGKGLTVLFSGPPGTGKTMAAEVIANALQMDLYRIDLAGVVSKYIGETEKNLSRIFREAEYSDAILFFDEADALFGKRSEVKDAHDRYANIEINYLLQQIESFEGVVVLATNLRQHLDEAFLRRIQVVVEFPMPEYEDRLSIWRQSFPQEAPLGPDVDFYFLARQFELAGGHIANIVLWAALLASEEGRDIGMRHCIRATRRELEKIGRRCMKEEFGTYAGLLELAPESEMRTKPGHSEN